MTRICTRVCRRTTQDAAPAATEAASGAANGAVEDSAAPPPPSFRRLLRFAAPEAPWITAGLLALLLRLPFSLAMPHFVSVALGRVIANDMPAARAAVRSFFAVGLANASLDFFNWWLFVVAQQRIIRRVHNELFAAIISSEIAFFDAASTGSLVSRLTSDCGQLANDLTWIFRCARQQRERLGEPGCSFSVRRAWLRVCAGGRWRPSCERWASQRT
jgi:ATP-binding cassette subfamily B (MDR/TAP) protein 9